MEKLSYEEMEAQYTLMKSSFEDVSREKDYYKNEAESFWAELKKNQKLHLEIAQRIVKTDSKAVANIILNMYFGKMPSDSCSFCEIFDLKGKGCCKEGRRCTDCIDDFLREYYKANRAE